MKIFKITKNEIKTIKNRYKIAIFSILGVYLATTITMFILHNRFYGKIYFIITVILTIAAIIAIFFFVFDRLRAVKGYERVLNCYEKFHKEIKLYYVTQDEDIVVHNSLSYCRYYFETLDHSQAYEFLVLYDADLKLKERDFVKINYIEDIAVEIEDTYAKTSDF